MFRMGKRDPTIYCLQVMHLNYKDRLKVNEKKREESEWLENNFSYKK